MTDQMQAVPDAVDVEVAPFGATAVLVLATGVSPAAVADHVRQHLDPALFSSVVPGGENVVVNAATGVHSPALALAVAGACRDLESGAASTSGRLVEIPVVYDGEDLSGVASLLHVSSAEVVARHSRAEYRVDFLGFAPGFPYLSGLDPLLATIPRLDVPRRRVPAGSVGLAAGRTCVYPSDSPGGWYLLGSTSLTLFDPTLATTPALLAAGDTVRFVPVPGA